MTAYMIAEITVLDAEQIAEYRAMAASAIEEFGGTFVVRGGAAEQVEGERSADERIVVVAFPSMAVARAWYASPAYAKALAVKDAAMTRRVTFLQGV